MLFFGKHHHYQREVFAASQTDYCLNSRLSCVRLTKQLLGEEKWKITEGKLQQQLVVLDRPQSQF